MNGISNPTLAAGKMFVNGNAHKFSNFEACLQYFYALVEVDKTATGDGAQEGGYKSSLEKHGRNPNPQQKQKKPVRQTGSMLRN